MTKKKKAGSAQRILVPLVRCGEFMLTRVDGILFLSLESGEGMEVNEKQFEATLLKFYEEWF